MIATQIIRSGTWVYGMPLLLSEQSAQFDIDVSMNVTLEYLGRVDDPLSFEKRLIVFALIFLKVLFRDSTIEYTSDLVGLIRKTLLTRS